VTDRNRVTTDPGLGPIEREHASTLRSITAAEPIPEDEIPGAPVYFEPKPLHAVSEHKTLELETVKLAKDIDPRKLPTELKLRRPVLHVLPASDPNWPAPAPLPDAGNLSPLFDSNWPPPETVLTTSTPPLATRRRSFVPLVLLVVLAACFLLVFGARRARHRALAPAVAVQAAQPPAPVLAPPVTSAEALPSTVPAPAASEIASANPATPPADSAESPEALDSSAAAVPSASAEPATSAAPARFVDAPHHVPIKSSAPSSANGTALSAPTAKPKKLAIY
jgi:hypothetical protein